ncbi:hypothetical protein DPMN_090260 [Dreissena polymorpha]|uniref:Uncharacterized protein n=1 Tax=Dreissena polymorpha TaxID=45954 RepID=A0A9D4KYE5_DREPO|nr:hypothetical protein DPMN_090260 [Dreissena polymorpha]
MAPAAAVAPDQPQCPYSPFRSYPVDHKVMQAIKVSLGKREAIDKTEQMHRLAWSYAGHIWD